MDPDQKKRRKRVHHANDFEAPPQELTEALDPEGEWQGPPPSEPPAIAPPANGWGFALATLLLLSVLPLALTLPRLLGERALSAPRAPAAEKLVQDAHLSDLSQVLAAEADRSRIVIAWEHGQLATWDETVEIGAPLLASTDTGALFPPHLLWRLLGTEESQPWLAGLALLLLGLGMHLFLSRRELAGSAAWVGAVGLQASGYFVANLHAPWRVWSVLFLPWMLLGIERIYARQRGGVLFTMAACALSFYAGAPRLAFLAAACALAWTLTRGLLGFLAKEPTEGAPRALALSTAALLCGIGAAGPQLWPEFEAFGRSALAGLDGATFTDLAVRTSADLKSVLLAQGGIAGSVDGRLYLGAPLLALALAGLFGATRRALFPLGLAVFSLLALAAVEPLPSLLRALPAGEHLRPREFASLSGFAFAWMAALGAHACLQRIRRPWFVLFFSLGVVTFAGLIQATRLEGEAESTARALASWTGAAVCLFTLARVMVTRTSVGARRFPWAIVALLLAGGGIELAKARSPHRDLFEREAADALIAMLEESDTPRGTTWIEVARTEELARTLASDSFAVHARRAGWRHLSARRPYPNAALHRLLDELGALRHETWTGSRRRLVLEDEIFLNRGLFDLLQVRYTHSIERLGEASGVTSLASANGAILSERTVLEPFARLAPERVVRTPNLSALNKMVALSILSGSPSQPLHASPEPQEEVEPNRGPAVSFAAARVHLAGQVSGSKLEARVEGGSGGRLVFREAYYPGWKATVNGEDVEVEPADAVFRQLTPIESDLPSAGLAVRSKYEPWSLRYGSLLGLFSLLLTAYLARRA